MGAKPISEYESERIDSTIKNLRLETGIAQQVLTDVTKQRFKAYVQQAQKERDRKASAGERWCGCALVWVDVGLCRGWPHTNVSWSC